MKNSADLGGWYPPRPSASVDNTLLDLPNSSYPTQPHSIIAKYTDLNLSSREMPEKRFLYGIYYHLFCTLGMRLSLT